MPLRSNATNNSERGQNVLANTGLPTPGEPYKLLPLWQTAKYLSVAPRTVMKWVDNGRLNSVVKESNHYFRADDVLNFMIEHGLEPPSELIAMLPNPGKPIITANVKAAAHPVPEPDDESEEQETTKATMQPTPPNTRSESNGKDKEPKRDTYFSQDVTVGNWVSAQIQVTTDKGRSVKIKAKVMGYVAVHPPLPEDPERTPFVLSSSSTGLMIARVNTEIDAQRIGYFLMSKFTYAMSRKTQQDIVSKLPQWVLEWIRTCRKEMKYVEPQQPG